MATGVSFSGAASASPCAHVAATAATATWAPSRHPKPEDHDASAATGPSARVRCALHDYGEAYSGAANSSAASAGAATSSVRFATSSAGAATSILGLGAATSIGWHLGGSRRPRAALGFQSTGKQHELLA